LSEAVTGQRLTVGASFFNKWMLPIGLVLLFLTGYGPLTAWRKSTITNLRDGFLFPGLCGVVVGGTVFALGVRVWASGICFAFSAFVAGTILQEFWRGARVRQNATGTDILTALIGLVARNKRRYGGYIIPVGIVLIFLGFAGNGFSRNEEVTLKPGQQTTVGDFTVHLNGVKVTDDGQKQMITADTTLLRGGKEIARMYPARWFYRKHEEEPTTEVAIRRGFAEDVYLVMPAFSVEEQSASMGIHINPLVDWVWAGFGVLAIGTGIALLPDTVFSFALASLPASAATASMLLLALVLWPSTLLAQQNVPVTQKSAVQKQVEGEIMCTCGCRQAVGSCGMLNCPGHKGQEEKLAAYLAEGKDHDQIIDAFVADYGSEAVLTAPRDRGFNRVAWAFPYMVGVIGLIAVVVTARRWSTGPTATSAGEPGVDPSINARLDDELRDLD
jgi:cytochrome c-type biogenesis protein CcmF